MADILDWVENTKDFELETNKIFDEIDSDEEIKYIQPEPEEDTEQPHPQCHKKKVTKNRLVQSIDSALDPSNYDEISYLNKPEHWETFVGCLGTKFNKATKKVFWLSDTPPITDRQPLCDVIPGGSYSILRGNARNIETF